jgi:type III secretion protein L
MSTGYAILDPSALRLKICGRRIPAADYGYSLRADQILKQAEALLAQAGADAIQIRTEAMQTGYREGYDKAFAELTVALVQARIEAEQALTSDLSHAVVLAERMLARLLPRLAREKIVPELLQGALSAIRDEQHITLSVHPDDLALARQAIKDWSESSPHRSELTVVADPSLEKLSCHIRSELGEIQTGIGQQLQDLKAIALQAAIEAEATPDGSA